MADPYTLVENLVVSRLQSSVAVSAIIEDSNILQFGANLNPKHDVVTEALIPNALIQAETTSQSLSYASNATHISASYALSLNTGQWNIQDHMNPLRFALVAAFADLLYSAELQATLWNGKKFILDVDLLPGEIGLSDTQENNGIDGFSAVFQFTTEMVFTRADLIAYNQGTL